MQESIVIILVEICRCKCTICYESVFNATSRRLTQYENTATVSFANGLLKNAADIYGKLTGDVIAKVVFRSIVSALILDPLAGVIYPRGGENSLIFDVLASLTEVNQDWGYPQDECVLVSGMDFAKLQKGIPESLRVSLIESEDVLVDSTTFETVTGLLRENHGYDLDEALVQNLYTQDTMQAFETSAHNNVELLRNRICFFVGIYTLRLYASTHGIGIILPRE